MTPEVFLTFNFINIGILILLQILIYFTQLQKIISQNLFCLKIHHITNCQIAQVIFILKPTLNDPPLIRKFTDKIIMFPFIGFGVYS